MQPPRLSRNMFDMSHEVKTSCDMGKLIPIFCEETLPGDKWNVNTNVLVRLSPLLAPVMHRIDVYTHFFFVPNRTIWTDFEDFITGGEDGLDASVAPTITMNNETRGELPDFFRVPSGVATNVSVSALPFRAYNFIYNEWYRDQWLQNKVAISKASGVDSTTAHALLTRNWEKDYYTSALKSPQKGTAVNMPLGTDAPVVSTGNDVKISSPQFANRFLNHDTGVNIEASGSAIGTADTIFWGNDTGMEADLSSATPASINQLREAFTIQGWLEKNARFGSRYVESILSHFGVRSSDKRLQRPEFLGGGKSPVVVSEIAQTGETGTTPQGTLAGHGFSLNVNHSFRKYFEEHGYIIGIMSIMPRTAYQQGLPRTLTRTSKYDYMWPAFTGLGEQAVYRKEIYLDTTGNDDVFGYQGRYDEYRRRESSVHGEFKDTGGSGLSFWHMGRILASAPTLSSAFITADPTNRIFAVPSKPGCLVTVQHNAFALRPLPREAVPFTLGGR